MLRTHLELPPDPTPTDRMPALKQKDVLAQAKVAAQDAKDPAVEPKSLGVDPRATAVAGKGAEAAKAPPPAKSGGKGAPDGAKATTTEEPKSAPAKAAKNDGNVIDLNAAKAAGRPASKRR
jgi:hypothetical protein